MIKRILILLGLLSLGPAACGGGGGESSESSSPPALGGSLALTDDGHRVFAWGNNAAGQLGVETSDPTVSAPMEVPGLSNIRMMAAGLSHSVALLEDGTVYAWGSNFFGELGDPDVLVYSPTPVPVKDLTGVAAIAAGAYHTVALLNDGTVRSWGCNLTGQLGDGTIAYGRFSPVTVVTSAESGSPLTGVRAVSAGMAHTLALREDGRVSAWGNHFVGQLGNSTFKDLFTFLIETGRRIPDELPEGEELWDWMVAFLTEVAEDAAMLVSPAPVEVENLSDVRAVSAGALHSLALLGDGTVRAWGSNFSGELGNGSFANFSVAPVVTQMVSGLSIKDLDEVAHLAAGGLFSAAIRSDKKIYVWGNNAVGQLATNLVPLSPLAIKVSGVSDVAEVAVSLAHILVRIEDGTIRGWGSNAAGQLGIGTTSDAEYSPVTPDLSGIQRIAAGWGHSLAYR